MATIGTFFKNGDGYRGLISTATMQARVDIVRDYRRGPLAYKLISNRHIVGRANATGLHQCEQVLDVQLKQIVAPGLGRATLKPLGNGYILTA